MSIVTNIIVIFDEVAEEKRIAEINSFKLREDDEFSKKLDLVNIHDKKLPEGWYGGGKYFAGEVLIGAYNHFELERFLRHIQTNVNWEYPEEVQVLIKEQEDTFFKVFIPGIHHPLTFIRT